MSRNPREYVIYTDESDKDGRYFSNFYGGVLVRSTDLDDVVKRLEKCKRQENLLQEVKWQKVTANYLEKYRALMGEFFDLVAVGRIKVRIMFTQNRVVPKGLSAEQCKNEYYLLYYQFLKHAFGLTQHGAGNVNIRVNLDQLPANREETTAFRSYILRLNLNAQFRAAGIQFRDDQIAEVNSKDHVLLQCLDVVLGGMCFRLNDKHKEKPPGQRRRGNRTIAKEKLYKFMNQRVREIHPGFNVGESTGKPGGPKDVWNHAYRHWKFVAKDHEIDKSRQKPKK